MSVQKIILLIASIGDALAPSLVRECAAFDVRLVTPAEVSALGWRFTPGRPDESVAKVAGDLIATKDIAGIITRLPWIFEQDLPHIARADRTYVVAELNAFLVAWLHDVPCRVVNRPTASCLSGPGWRHEQWIRKASALGIPARPSSRAVPSNIETKGNLPAVESITVIGKRTFGCGHANLAEHAARLSRSAGVDMLVAYFDGPEANAAFVGANPWPRLDNQEMITAVIESFGE